jgi:hypothetical protein
MPSTTELCVYCQKSYRSLIQHYRKSFCGQIHHSKKVDNATEVSQSGKKIYADDSCHDPMVENGYDDLTQLMILKISMMMNLLNYLLYISQ